MKMRALVYRGPGVVAVEDIPLPQLEPGDVLLRVRAASVCATDHKIVAHGHFKIPPGVPRVLGHELVGEVVEGGTVHPQLAPGTRVGVAPNVGCGSCPACIQGLDNLCPRYEAIGITYDGGLAEFVRIPARMVQRGLLIPLDDAVSDEEGALIEPMSCVAAAHETVGTRCGDRVLVLGAGPMGLMHVLWARTAGAALVVAVEPVPTRRELAVALGADAAVPPEQLDAVVQRFTGGEGFDVVIVTVPAREAQERSVHLAAVMGRVHLFAGLPKGVPHPTLDTHAIHYRQLVVTGSTGSSALHYRRTAELVRRRRLQLGGLISRRGALEDVLRVLAGPRSPEEMKVVVSP